MLNNERGLKNIQYKWAGKTLGVRGVGVVFVAKDT